LSTVRTNKLRAGQRILSWQKRAGEHPRGKMSGGMSYTRSTSVVDRTTSSGRRLIDGAAIQRAAVAEKRWKEHYEPCKLNDVINHEWFFYRETPRKARLTIAMQSVSPTVTLANRQK